MKQTPPEDKFILDVCCGGKTMWFDKNHANTIYLDIRDEEYKLNYERNKQKIIIKPDLISSFTDIPFVDNCFNLVVFDPPHRKFSNNSIMFKKYGTLDENWKDIISKGFDECFRVLKNKGVLVFKWAESSIKSKDVLSLTEVEPLFGHKTSRNNTWFTFLKNEQSNKT